MHILNSPTRFILSLFQHYDALPTNRNGRAPAARTHERNRSSIASVSDRPLPTANPYTAAAPVVPVTAPLWDQKDDVDPLHDPDPLRDARDDNYCDPFSWRGWLNVSAIMVICFGLIALFAGYPIITWAGRYQGTTIGYNVGGINSTGQVPVLPGLPSLIDTDTPSSVKTRTGYDGKKYNLVFSDEFNTDDRTFFPGDDAFWEAVDLHYWPTGDLEWYSPERIYTKNGSLVIEIEEILNHELNFQSGMLQSWNKFCFSSGYIEVNVSLPGSHVTPGYWPAIWTMGNLGRAGYGATTDGMWPYSYDACDDGTYYMQQDKSGNPSVQTQLAGITGDVFSSLPGQRASACTCNGADHPGPNTGTGRGVPEIDVFEAQIEPTTWQGEVSQSFQIAPFNAGYQFNEDGTTQFDTGVSKWNTYKGGAYQQAVSTVTNISNTAYNGDTSQSTPGWSTYGFEYWGNKNDRDNGYIVWYVNGTPSWIAKADAVGPDGTTLISQRLISEEPMYIIMNLGMAPSFQHQDYTHMPFPAYMLVDYVRVYQRQGSTNVGCNPSGYPTTNYINNHLPAYTDANYTTWQQAGYEFPPNSKYDGC
ncbi:glycoside hydrolase family 16 protein [Clavulina sp. PMI_390]|nr:glycoside hydrolase family 16 protein [Clavulina sp. PMI_390]